MIRLALGALSEAGRTFRMPEKKIVKLSNSIDPDETAHNELSWLIMSCLIWIYTVCPLVIYFFPVVI